MHLGHIEIQPVNIMEMIGKLSENDQEVKCHLGYIEVRPVNIMKMVDSSLLPAHLCKCTQLDGNLSPRCLISILSGTGKTLGN